ncbi:hypothetical protein K439DRAFT_764416 [Ramaria rubella]|nr:hypothetical protein K439DRAFT_764416 [Ramaria rubella]
MVEDYSRTPSLSNSEETVSSASELPLTTSIISPSDGALSFAKGVEKASRVPKPTPRLPTTSSTRSTRYASSHGVIHSFVITWSHPSILQCLLSCVGWREFHAVTSTCRTLRNLFGNPRTRDVALARFVPGYSSDCRDDAEEVSVSLPDLEALMMSQSLPLHRYPMHAVYIVSALHGIPPQARSFSDRLIRLAQAHSRFVLLLRSRAPHWQVSLDRDDFIRRTSPPPVLRELTFPAPLSYFDNTQDKPPPPPPSEFKILKKRLSSTRRPTAAANPPTTERLNLPRPGKKRLSIFGSYKERIPLPEPRSSPPSIKFYSSRRHAHRATTMSIYDEDLLNRHSRFMSDNLPPPRYPFASRDSSSPSSSVGSLSRSATSPVPMSMSPHELSNALSHVIAAIEDQLFAGGLWEHLRTGDVVCNLGYVPADSGSARGWLIFTGEGLWPFFPPAPPPVPDMTALPSPLYYSHILPPFENIRCVLWFPKNLKMSLKLTPLSSNVPSPHSPSGQVRVKRYAWLGRISIKDEETGMLGLGEGWAGEWILEAEGTKEGKQILMDAVEGDEHRFEGREWEIVREECGLGKLWLRLIPEQKELDNLSAEHSTSTTR